MEQINTNLKPEFILFDLDNTLYNYEPSHVSGESSMIEFITNELSLSEKFVVKGLSEARENVKTRLGKTAASHSRILYVNEFLNKHQICFTTDLIQKAERVYWDNFLERTVLREHAWDFLQDVRSLEIPMYLITDLTLQIQTEKINRLKLQNIFRHVISSEDAGGDKVTFKPFELLKQYTKCTGKHFWAIGDKCWDFPQEDDFRGRDFSLVALKCEHNHELANFEQLSDILRDICKMEV